MANVSLKNVRKLFGSVTVIPDISLDINDGEFVVLVGPSGCGKSTLLRMIAGLEPISSGEVSIGGKVVNDAPARDRGISMVFQSYALYPHMTSEENMNFSLRLKGEHSDGQKQKVGRASDVLGLSKLLDRFPRQLSGGQRQRVAMGRAIVREPEVFLFDEPLSNLDATLRVKMRAEIKELHQRLATTTIYVTHDQIEAMTLADRIVVLRDGHIEQIGSPLELYDNPVNQFVGSFLGSPAMNFLDANRQASATDPLHFSDGDTLMVDDLSHVAPGPLQLGIRPESFSIVSEPSDHSIHAEIVVVEPTGAQTQLVMRKGGNELTATFGDRLNVKPGESIHLQVNQNRLHMFDHATGSRLS
ncbi:ABC transporter ATP-binding protein [Pararhizobium sp. IMCC21322]|uniref:ABC transporter ATP-binding protein n=1 Tax=Pararhizobium sp. IMCC21322 TaxID=3067903 RepID=UPI0027418460|nr:sn-glycerol-3-phosphate ABC transporter ATP-binding protein UgpC [Pararhizobium sp. IMCC21322]